ncbi:hypothetical protein CLV68_6180 [Actinokineospora cianjurensis]|uniref:Uncharacterized protein n=1 Tax=Actinokineospora cianjurensis TaxID=585224 RepID=A0A421AWS4_9PSEU|nr:hypothetical protein CLV68_6180 [Actinokineospora cianjurensis]
MVFARVATVLLAVVAMMIGDSRASTQWMTYLPF